MTYKYYLDLKLILDQFIMYVLKSPRLYNNKFIENISHLKIKTRLEISIFLSIFEPFNSLQKFRKIQLIANRNKEIHYVIFFVIYFYLMLTIVQINFQYFQKN